MTTTHTLWLTSIALEAAVLWKYRKRSGFPAFRAFLLADILAQLADLAVAGTPWYRQVFRVGDMIVCVMTAFAVIEAGRKMPSPAKSAPLIFAVAILIHMLLCEPMPWYSAAVPMCRRLPSAN